MDDLEDDKINNLLVNNNPPDEDGELTQTPVINIHDNNRNTAAMDGWKTRTVSIYPRCAQCGR